MHDSLRSEVATWSVDLSTRQVTRSANHDILFGHPVNLPHWNIEHFLTHVHPDDVAHFTAVFRDAIERNETFDFEFRIILASGEIRRLRSAGQVVFGTGGLPTTVIGSTRLV